ncbi:Zinc finger protein like [Verticillium longisporum]|nr:Zinc finger protein like [Verticillium longisporum]
MDDSYGIDMGDFTVSEQLNFEMFTELDPTPSFTQGSESHNHFYHGSGTSHDDTCIDPNASFMFSSRLDNDALMSQPSAPPPRSAPSAAAAAAASAAPRPRQSSMPTETSSTANSDFTFHGFQWTNAAAANFNTLPDPNYDLLPNATDEAAASPKDAPALTTVLTTVLSTALSTAKAPAMTKNAKRPSALTTATRKPATPSRVAQRIIVQTKRKLHLMMRLLLLPKSSKICKILASSGNSAMDSSPVSFEQAAAQVEMMGKFIDTMPLNPTIDPFFEHIYQCHDPNQPQCVEPCVLSTFPTQYAQCPFPQRPEDHLNQNAFYQGDHSPTTEIAKCDTKFQTTSELVAHFNEQHRPALAATNHTFASPQYNMQHPSPAPMTRTIKGITFRRGTGHLNGSPTLMQRPLSAMTASSTLTGDSAQISTPATPESESFSRASNQCRWVAHGQICGLTFRNEVDLHQHVRDHHTSPLRKEVGGFPCHWHKCIRKLKGSAGNFHQKSKLDRHLQVHTGFKPVECEVCGLHLSAKQSLDQHMRIHTGDEPWICTWPGCGASFKQQSALTMHTRTHTGVKPLACNICGRTFSESSNLSKHRRTHNLKGDHVCDMCGKDFRRLDQLRRHVKTKHKNDCGGGMAKAKADSDQSGLDLTFQSSPQFDALDAMLQGFPKLETSPL